MLVFLSTFERLFQFAAALCCFFFGVHAKYKITKCMSL